MREDSAMRYMLNLMPKLALAAREVRETHGAELLRSEPIAVVGVGCRVPKGEGPEGYWDMLAAGTDGGGGVMWAGSWTRGLPRATTDRTSSGSRPARAQA